MYDSDLEPALDKREQLAQARGERIRAELKVKLRDGGPQAAEDLLPQLPKDVSLSEVAFQLERLAEEGEVSGGEGGPYRLLS